ncbi:hypothetical protein SESBI_34167 [Sesbania bispinosa]|nr:hypothetical protein SESBI_34167 [Sesbania bispinosa]
MNIITMQSGRRCSILAGRLFKSLVGFHWQGLMREEELPYLRVLVISTIFPQGGCRFWSVSDTVVAGPSTIDPISNLYKPSDQTHDNQKPKDTRPQEPREPPEWKRDYC